MKPFSILYLLLCFFLLHNSQAMAGEIKFELQSHQRLIGTYSGDIDQENSIHLLVIKDRESDDFKVRPFFIDQKGDIVELQEVAFQKKPSILSYHIDPMISKLTLVATQGKGKEQNLDIIDFILDSGATSRRSIPGFEDAYMVIRSAEKTFLIDKAEEELKIRTIYNSKEELEKVFPFKGEDLKLFEKIFEVKPESINTSEFVENGSINPSKVYYVEGKLIFDHKSEESYITLSLDPETAQVDLKKFDLSDVGKIKDINTFIHGFKSFLFINNKEDINLRIYDLKNGELLTSKFLLEELPEGSDRDALEKIISKTSGNRLSLTGTINEGIENTLVMTLDYVSTHEYFYHYNWWWHHWFFQQHMMWNQHQMMMQNIQRQMMNFGPSPAEDLDIYFSAEVDNSVQLVLGENLNFQRAEEVATVRPKIDKEKYIRPFEKNERINDVSMAFTAKNVRIIYYSQDTEAIHLKTFNL